MRQTNEANDCLGARVGDVSLANLTRTGPPCLRPYSAFLPCRFTASIVGYCQAHFSTSGKEKPRTLKCCREPRFPFHLSALDLEKKRRPSTITACLTSSSFLIPSHSTSWSLKTGPPNMVPLARPTSTQISLTVRGCRKLANPR